MNRNQEHSKHHQRKTGGAIEEEKFLDKENALDVKKVLIQIEKEHATVAVKQKNGAVNKVHVIVKDPHPAAAIEWEAEKRLMDLRLDPLEPKVPFKKSAWGEVVEATGYGWFVHNLGDIIASRVPHFIYSEPLNLFFDEMEKLGIVEDETFGLQYVQFGLPEGGSETAKKMEVLLGSTKLSLRSDDFKKKLDIRKAHSRRIKKAFTKMFHRCLEKCARILIVRVDLEYALNEGELGAHPLFSRVHPDLFALDVFRKDKNRFINNFRDRIAKGRLSDSLLEWGWKAEYGVLRGWHLHGVFIFDASKVRSAWYHAMWIGELWERLTEGRGSYYNCHSNPSKYIKSCLGEVRRGNADARKGFEYLANYLAMDDQMPIVRTSLKSQVFGISRYGTRSKKCRGVQEAHHAA